MPTWLLVSALFALFCLVCRYGADSRDGQDWRTRSDGRMPPEVAAYHREHSPARDLATICRMLHRAAIAFVEFNRAQVDMRERHLRSQQAWDADELRWVETSDGWRLDGRIVPPMPHRRDVDPIRRRGQN